MTETISARRRTPPRRFDGPVALAAEILRGTADLRGAACTSEPKLYDPDVQASELGLTDVERWEAVKAICVGCPARGRCWEWASGLNGHRRPRGPLADVQSDPFAGVRRWDRRRAGIPDPDPEPRPPKPEPKPRPPRAECLGRECERPAARSGLCASHAARMRRHPDQPRDILLRPLGEPLPRPEPEPERVDPEPPPPSVDPEPVRSPRPRRPVWHTTAWVRRCLGCGCSKPAWANGLCQAHNMRLHRDPDQPRDILLGPLRRSPRDPGDPPPPKRGARSRVRPNIHRKKNRARRHRR